MLAVIVAILKFIGILLLVILGLAVLLCAVVLFVPVRYFVECSNEDHLRVGYSLSWLFRAVKYKKGVTEQEGSLYIFGIDLESYKSLFRRDKREYKDIHLENSKVNMVDDFYEEAKKEEERVKANIKTDYEEPKEEKVKEKRKKSFSFDRISSIINFIRDFENQSGLRKIKKELAALVRYLMPDRMQGRIVFGTGDPCTTGWVLGIISMFPAAYAEGIKICPDFEEKVFEAEGYVRGKLRLIYFVRLFLRGYLDEEIKAVITKALKYI